MNRRVNSRGRVVKQTSTRGGTFKASSRQRTVAKPYTPNEHPAHECVYFSSTESWKTGQSGIVPEIKKFVFNDGFDITDAHLDAIIAKGPSVCHSLRDFRAGDAETGMGGSLTDAGVIRFVKASPNLVHVKLDGARNLADASLFALFTNCPNLLYVQFSGNDRNHGNLKGTALATLTENPGLASKLVKLRLTDQADDTKFTTAVKTLSARRKKLAIEVGNTHERGGSVNTWIGGKERSGYQALGGPGGFDSYGGFGGAW